MKQRKFSLNDNPLLDSLPLELSENLRSFNPWWIGKPSKQIPSFHRWAFNKLKHLLIKGVPETTALRGPRRVGKTILLRQIIESFLSEGLRPQRLFYVPFDELPTFRGLSEPILDIARWFQKEVLKCTFNELARVTALGTLVS